MYWDILNEFNTIRREMDCIFGEPGKDRISFSPVAFLPGKAARRYPLVNVSEDKDNLYVETLAPGVRPDSLDVTVVRDTLTISGEKPVNGADVKPGAFHRNERAAGKFIRTVELPVEIEDSKVTADYKNGILMVVLPKAEKTKPKQINISVS